MSAVTKVQFAFPTMRDSILYEVGVNADVPDHARSTNPLPIVVVNLKPPFRTPPTSRIANAVSPAPALVTAETRTLREDPAS